jgi:hypothetical protein
MTVLLAVRLMPTGLTQRVMVLAVAAQVQMKVVLTERAATGV